MQRGPSANAPEQLIRYGDSSLTPIMFFFFKKDVFFFPHRKCWNLPKRHFQLQIAEKGNVFISARARQTDRFNSRFWKRMKISYNYSKEHPFFCLFFLGFAAKMVDVFSAKKDIFGGNK